MTESGIQTASPPTSLVELLGYSSQCACGRVHEVTTKFAHICKGAIDRLPEEVARLGTNLRIGLLADRITDGIAGEKLASLLRKSGHRVHSVILPDGPGGRPHATDKSCTWVENGMKGMDLLVAAGSGTINDLCKLASFRMGIPYISVATAPSMNGYTSAIAAIMKDGIKRTVSCHQPHGVIADLDILANTPLHLVAAGLGDLESKPSSTADYRLSGRVKGTYYCSVPEVVVFHAEQRAASYAEGLQKGDLDAIEALMEALLLSGISMKLAGSSSPASGGEHLISHHWDMTAAAENRIEGWHGSQVGVATIVTTTLYEYLQQVRPETIDVDQILSGRKSRSQMEAQILAFHGEWGNEAVQEYFQKYLDNRALGAELVKIVNNWSHIWSDLGEILRPSKAVAHTLHSAGAPTHVQALGLTRDHLRRSYLHAREIRGRYTVLDFAWELGLLDPTCDDILTRSGCLG